jgi:DNA-binding GntR family transcriptional regulator
MSVSRSSLLIDVPSALPNLRKGDALYHALKKRILLAEFEPGVALTEQHIATGFGCSQGTVREALMRLEQDGLVARRSYQGTVVAATSLAEAAAMVTIRIRIESTGVVHTAGKLAPEHKARLQQTVHKMGLASDACEAYACSELDREFHAQLLRASGMHALEPILRRCTLHMHRFTYGTGTEFFADGDFSAAHQRLLHVIETGPVAAATNAIQAHVLEVLRQWSPELLNALDAD